METTLLPIPQWLDTSGTTYQGDKAIVILNSSIETQNRQRLQEKAKGKVCLYLTCRNGASETLEVIVDDSKEKTTFSIFLCKEHNTKEFTDKVMEWFYAKISKGS